MVVATHETESGVPVGVGALLAGGEARRMGADKRLLRLAGATLLSRNLAFLQGIFPSVALSLRDAEGAPEPFPPGVVVVPDAVPGSPLAGIAALLAHFNAPVFVLAADVALPDETAVRRVLEAFRETDVALPVLRDHCEPLHAVYGPGCLAAIERILEQGGRRVRDLLPEVRVAEVRFADDAPFFNVNTPADWNKARRRFQASRRAGATGEEESAATPAARAAREPERPVVLGVAGRSGSGKTTLIERLIPELLALGLRVGAVKRAARFEIDSPGKDSWRHGEAGATAYAVASPAQLAYVTETPDEVPLGEIVREYLPDCDLVVAEGYRHEAPHRIEVFRSASGHGGPLCGPGEALAVVSDADLRHPHRFRLDEEARLARFLAARLGLGGTGSGGEPGRSGSQPSAPAAPLAR